MQKKEAATVGGIFWCKILMLAATGFALELALTAIDIYAIPVLLETGLQEKYASLIWAIPPVLDLFVESYLGSASDRCKCSWGRRRPFILGCALIAGTSVAVLAFGTSLAEKLFHGHGKFLFWMLPLAFVIADFSLDALESPVRMYLLDSVPLEVSDKANYIYAAVLALGSLFGSVIGVVDWENANIPGNANTTSENVIDQTHVVFEVSFYVFVVCVLLTLCSVKEKRTNHRTELESDDSDSSTSTDSESSSVSTFDGQSPTPEARNGEVHSMAADHMNGEVQPEHSKDNKLERAESKEQPYGIISKKEAKCFSTAKYSICHCLREVFKSIRDTWEFTRHISKPTLLLMLMEFLDWFFLLSAAFFFSDYVGKVIYGGSPTSSGEELALYAKGVRMSCWCAVIEDSVNFIYTLSLNWLSKYVSQKCLLLTGHLMVLITLAIALFSESLLILFLVSIGEGMLYGNMDSIHYSLIPYYKVSCMMQFM